jgi:hypothetical protein
MGASAPMPLVARWEFAALRSGAVLLNPACQTAQTLP